MFFGEEYFIKKLWSIYCFYASKLFQESKNVIRIDLLKNVLQVTHFVIFRKPLLKFSWKLMGGINTNKQACYW